MPSTSKAQNKNPTSLLPWLLLLLSVTTGLVDAISIMGLGKVFTANMTGNIVFLGFAAVGAPGFRIAPYMVAIAAFLCGAVISGRAAKAHIGRSLRRWLLVAALIETVLLWIAAAIASGFDIATQAPKLHLLTIIALTAVAMGFRNATVRRLKVPDLTTTVLTLTLTGLAADSSLSGGNNTNWKYRIGAISAIFLGSAIGAVIVMHTGLTPALILAGALVLFGTLACSLHPTYSQPIEA